MKWNRNEQPEWKLRFGGRERKGTAGQQGTPASSIITDKPSHGGTKVQVAEGVKLIVKIHFIQVQ